MNRSHVKYPQNNSCPVAPVCVSVGMIVIVHFCCILDNHMVDIDITRYSCPHAMILSLLSVRSLCISWVCMRIYVCVYVFRLIRCPSMKPWLEDNHRFTGIQYLSCLFPQPRVWGQNSQVTCCCACIFPQSLSNYSLFSFILSVSISVSVNRLHKYDCIVYLDKHR